MVLFPVCQQWTEHALYLLKVLNLVGLSWLTHNEAEMTGTVSEEYQTTAVAPVLKKGGPTIRESHCSEFLRTFTLGCLKGSSDQLQNQEKQCTFGAGHGAVDQIFRELLKGS